MTGVASRYTILALRTPTPISRSPPNGKYVAVDKTDTTNENTDVFVYDMARAAFRRLSFDPGIDAAPVWSPDGQIAFTSSRGHNFDIYVKAADGSLAEHLLQLPQDVDNL